MIQCPTEENRCGNGEVQEMESALGLLFSLLMGLPLTSSGPWFAEERFGLEALLCSFQASSSIY